MSLLCTGVPGPDQPSAVAGTFPEGYLHPGFYLLDPDGECQQFHACESCSLLGLRVVLTGAPVPCTGNVVDRQADIKAIPYNGTSGSKPGICPCESSACRYFSYVSRTALSFWLVP